MTPSTLPKKPIENWESVRDEWIAAVEELTRQAEAWARRQDWAVRRDAKTVEEDRLGAYTVPRLLIHTASGRLVLDPVARFVPGALGLVDFYVMPSYDTLTIARTEDGWRLHSDEVQEGSRPWSEEVFLETAHRLLDHAQ